MTIGPSPAALIACSASSRDIATVTPLPAASPSALITTGIEPLGAGEHVIFLTDGAKVTLTRSFRELQEKLQQPRS